MSVTDLSSVLEPTASPGIRRPLRVCHLAYTFYENDTRVIRYAEALAERGDSVDVIALRRAGQPARGISNRVRVFRIQRRIVNERQPVGYLLKLLWFLAKSTVFLAVLQLRRRYDLVHVHNVPDFLVFAALVPKLMGARIVLDIHDILPELYAGKFGAGGRSAAVFRALLLVERSSSKFADHVIVANHLWRERLLSRSLRREKCTPILNYPDLRLFRRCEEREEKRNDRFVLLYPGSLNHHQGVDLAVEAFRMVKDRMPGAELHIYGEGPARPRLEAVAARPDLVGRVRIRDRVPLADVPRLMASSDVGVVPKRADGFGNEAFSTKILEFMACGVPVIVARTRIDAHYFDETVVRFFSPGDTRELGAAMLAEYEQGAASLERVGRARKFAQESSWQAHAQDYVVIIDRLANASWREQRSAV